MTQVDSSSAIWAARLEVVAELASLINTTFDLDEILRTAILKIGKVLDFRRASIVLVTTDRSSYYLHTLYDGAKGGFVDEHGTYSIDTGLTGEAIRSGEAIRVDAFGGTEGIRTQGERIVSALIVPIQLDELVIGTVNFGAKETTRYDDRDLEFAVTLGRQIATSLHYSKLLATIQEQREALARQHERVVSERSRLEALIDASDAAILMVSGDQVAYANSAMADLLGLPVEVTLGAPLDRINQVLARSLADPTALAAQTEALLGSGTPLRDRVEFHFPRRLVCQRTVASVAGSGGEVLGHLVLYRDVTREAEAEAAKSEFVSMVSHELRTPLTSVKTSISLLLRGAAGAVSEAGSDLLNIALRNLDRLIRLVDDLLDLSRVESGRVEIDLRPISLDASLDQAAGAVAGFAQEMQVQVIREESVADLTVLADPDRLQQVIVNLLSNAIKFSPSGKRVALRWWPQGDHAVLEIADEGPGIPSDQLEKIFDKFHQLEQTSTRKYGGAGLGLAISRTIVDQMGGHLWAESEEGKGARFFVRLRVARGAAEDVAASPAMASRPRSVLLLESDADLLRLLETEFRNRGWAVSSTARGVEGLERLASGSTGVVAVGLSLADMHGLEFLQRLRASPDGIDVPAVLFGPGSDLRQAVSYGADGWVIGDADGLIVEAERLLATLRPPVVMLLEDDPAVRLSLARGLRAAGYACLESSNGATAAAIARARVPDLLLTDLQIPGKDGVEVLREFRADPDLSSVPAIVVSGHASPELLEHLQSLRAQFLRKPFATSTVLREVERVTGAP